MARELSVWTPRLPRTFRRLQEEMDSLMSRFFGRDEWLPESWFEEREWMPRVNVAETNKAIEVEAELPGLKPEEISVSLENGDLVISGEHKEEKEESGKTYRRVERHFGHVYRRIPLEREVDQEHVEAEYHEGILKVTLPKTEPSEVKRIPVKA